MVSGIIPVALTINAFYSNSSTKWSRQPVRGSPILPDVWKTPFGTSISLWLSRWRSFAHEMGIDVWEAIDAAATNHLPDYVAIRACELLNTLRKVPTALGSWS